jgi:hypothetical protein
VHDPFLAKLLGRLRPNVVALRIPKQPLAAQEIYRDVDRRSGIAPTHVIGLIYLRQVRSYLARREGRYDFFDESFKIAAIERYTGEAAEQAPGKRPVPQWHRLLAEYFQTQPAHLAPGRVPNVRKVDEQPWQQTKAGMWPELEQSLCDLSFLEAKTEAGSAFELAQDFSEAVKALPADRPRWRLLRLLEEALRTDLHFLVRHPGCFFQCLWNRGWWYDCPAAAGYYDPPEEGWPPEGPPWDRPEPRLSTLLEEWHRVKQEATPGFRWLCSLRPPPDHLGTAEAVFSGHAGPVTHVICSPDGKRVFSKGIGSIRLWDVVTGKELNCLLGEEAWPDLVAVSPDGQYLAAGGGSLAGVVFLWDTVTGRRLATISGHKDEVQSLVFSPDGLRLVSGARDGTIHVWNLAEEKGHPWSPITGYGVTSLAFCADGRKLVSGTADGAVWLWDASVGEKLENLLEPNFLWQHADFNDPTALIMNFPFELEIHVACSPDGRWIAFGTTEAEMRLWDAMRGELTQRLPFDGSRPSIPVFSPDGKYLGWFAKRRTREGALRPSRCGTSPRERSANSSQIISS